MILSIGERRALAAIAGGRVWYGAWAAPRLHMKSKQAAIIVFGSGLHSPRGRGSHWSVVRPASYPGRH